MHGLTLRRISDQSRSSAAEVRICIHTVKVKRTLVEERRPIKRGSLSAQKIFADWSQFVEPNSVLAMYNRTDAGCPPWDMDVS